MDSVLSPEEVDAVLSAVLQGETGEKSPDPAGERRVKKYDFREPDKLSKDQLRTLQMIHDSFARLLGTSFAGYLRTMVDAEVARVDQQSYDEFIRTLSNPTILAVFRVPPLEGSALVEINPDIGFAIIDRLLGGPGIPPKRTRELTEIEQTVVRRILQRALTTLQEAWTSVAEIQPKLDRLETNPQFLQLLAPKETVIVITVMLKVRDAEGNLNLCIPYPSLEPVVPKLSAHYLFSGGQRTQSGRNVDLLRQRLSTLKVPVNVVLGTGTLTIKQLLDLEAGDVIQLDTKADGDLAVRIGDRIKFWGRPGRMGSKLAVEISEVLVARGEGVEATDEDQPVRSGSHE